ncbi:hypothetical protein Bbelb_286240 [Branchiostoma belcheri]|nr:hypothetical protein Bbelb_286240 [Branchiostoma belcheri]
MWGTVSEWLGNVTWKNVNDKQQTTRQNTTVPTGMECERCNTPVASQNYKNHALLFQHSVPVRKVASALDFQVASRSLLRRPGSNKLPTVLYRILPSSLRRFTVPFLVHTGLTTTEKYVVHGNRTRDPLDRLTLEALGVLAVVDWKHMLCVRRLLPTV